MKKLWIILALVFGAQSASAAPEPRADWDWQLSENIAPPRGVQVLDFDPDNVTRAQVMALNNAGVYTICYVSVGTLENWRHDVNMFYDQNIFYRPVVGKQYDEWPDEFFLDIRNPGLKHVMAKRFMDCALKGFKAIEPDNLDVYENESGFEISREDTLRYIGELVKAAHSVGLEIGQKNVPELTGDLVGMMDFVITESCYQDGWCDQVSAYLDAGKPVFDAEYNDREIDFNKACEVAENMGISMILKDRDLTSFRQVCG